MRSTPASPVWVLSARVAMAAILAAAVACATPSATAPGPQAPASASSAATVAPAPKAPAAPPAMRASRWADEILYFVLVDRFADGDPSNNMDVDIHDKGHFHGGDLKGLTAHLDEIADLGVTAIWINPLVKNIDGAVTGAGFPDYAYHGYWADDFYALDPRFGTEADLKAFVDACHQRGIKVLLDVVYNHAGYDSHYTTDPRTKSWLRVESRGTCGSDDLTSCVSGLPDFKTELPEVADFLMKAHLGWAQRSGVDGFRLDTLKHVDHPFWQEHRRRTRAQLGQGFFLLGELWGGDAESLTPWFEPDEINAGFDFSFQGSTLGFLEGRGRTAAFNHYLETRHRAKAGHYLAHFLSSHDVDGALYLLKGDVARFRLAAVLQMTTLGIPTIYYGEEVARPGGTWPENRSNMPWGNRQILPGAGEPRDESLRAFYKTLIATRRAHPALSRGTHTAVAKEGDLLAFLRRDAESKDAVVVAINRGDKPEVLTFQAPEEWGAAEVVDVLGGEGAPARTGAQIQVSVPPRSARILATH